MKRTDRDNAPKPKLVLFRWAHADMANYIRLHSDQHVKCLSQFFDVTVISENCDYQRICDTYEPDLTLFESSVYGAGLARQVSNTSTNLQIPKLGFCNADAMCCSRSAFIADMDHWGIDTFFTLSVSMPDYTPDISQQLYIWPNSVDTDLYYDYGERKHIPVLFVGSQAPHYPWRNHVCKRVAQYYPSMVCPHFGWGSQSTTSRMIYGEQYARLLNASWFAPTCGTVAKDIVRKHFEIPASKACLVTEETPSTIAAGFVDGRNCVYADENNVIERLDYLFEHRDELEKIIAAGHALVQSQHTLKQRDQIFQWFVLHKQLKPHQRIIQPSPFRPLAIVDSRSGMRSSHLVSHGLDRALLSQGDDELWAGKYDAAEQFYLRALNYLPYLVEAQFRLAICNLYKGKAVAAFEWLHKLVKNSCETFCATEPDPIEWAYFLIALLCQGRVAEAAEGGLRYPELYHPELDRARRLIAVIQGIDHDIGDELLRPRSSVHQLPFQSCGSWGRHIRKMLNACGQTGLAEQCAGLCSVISEVRKVPNEPRDVSAPEAQQVRSYESIQRRRPPTLALPITERRFIARFFKWLRKRARGPMLKGLRRLESLFGYFMPYRLSAMKDDELFGGIESLARDPSIANILVVGASAGEGSTEASLAGARANPSRPIVVCVNCSAVELTKLERRNSGLSYIKCCARLNGEIRNWSGDGMVVVAAADGLDVVPYDRIDGASVVVLNHINKWCNFKAHQTLLAASSYTLSEHNPSYRDGYAIFKRK